MISRTLFGAHIQAATDDAVKSAARAAGIGIKTMAADPASIRDLLDREPQGIVIVRAFWEPSEQAELRARGEAGCEMAMQRIDTQFGEIRALCQRRGVKCYAEGLNEPDPNPWSDLPRLSAWYVCFAQQAKSYGYAPLAYSWGTGNPPSYGWGPGTPWPDYPASLARQWQDLIGGLEACVDAGGGGAWHAYDWPSVLSDPYWQGFRLFNDFDAIEVVAPALAPRVEAFITEWGWDVGIKPEYVRQFGEKKGWRTALHGDGAELVRQAAEYEARIRSNRWGAQVRIMVPFTNGPMGWDDYSFDNVPAFEAFVAAGRGPEGGDQMAEGLTYEILPGTTLHPGQSFTVAAHVRRSDGKPPVAGTAILQIKDYPLRDDGVAAWAEHPGFFKSRRGAQGLHDVDGEPRIDAAIEPISDLDRTIAPVNCVLTWLGKDFDSDATLTPRVANFSLSVAPGEAPSPPLPSPGDLILTALAPQYDGIYKAAGDIFNLAKDAGDARLQAVGIYVENVIRALKGEVADPGPFPYPRT